MNIDFTTQFCKTALIKMFSVIVVLSLLLTSVGAPTLVSAQATVPDYVSLEYETVPNILSVEIESQTYNSGENVTGKIKIKNPLNSYYLAIDLTSSDIGIFTPSGTYDALWGETLHLVPPKGEIEYDFQFSSTTQWGRVNSDFLSVQAFVANLMLSVLTLIPDVSSESPDKILQALGNIDDVVNMVSSSIDSGKVLSELAGDPISWKTPGRIITLAGNTWTFFGDTIGKQFVLAVLKKLNISVSDDVIKGALNRFSILGKFKVVADALVYGGISLWSGSLDNRYYLHPMIVDSANRPPLSPRLISPLSANVSIRPTFSWGDVLNATGYYIQVADNTMFSPVVMETTTVEHNFTFNNPLVASKTYYWRVRARNLAGLSEGNIGTFVTGPVTYDPPPTITSDKSLFITDITLPNGTVVSPNQSLTKTWQVKNTGTSTWSGYKLKFVNGEQLNGPSEITLPTTAPGETKDISINLAAPASAGLHSGEWQIVNTSGTWVPGGNLWIKINVQTGNSGNILINADPPSPSGASQVRFHVRANSSSTFRSTRIKIDGSVVYELGALDFYYDWNTAGYAAGDHSIIVEVADQTDTSWNNPQRQSMVYTLLGSTTVVNHAPNRPGLVANPAY